MGNVLQNVWRGRLRNWLVRIIMLGAILPMAPTFPLPAQPALTTTQKPVKELIRLVRQDCGSCHGLTLKGGLGKPLLPENLAGRDADTLAQIILDGIPGTPMPPWRGILSERDARWIARKLKEGFPHAAP